MNPSTGKPFVLVAAGLQALDANGQPYGPILSAPLPNVVSGNVSELPLSSTASVPVSASALPVVGSPGSMMGTLPALSALPSASVASPSVASPTPLGASFIPTLSTRGSAGTSPGQSGSPGSPSRTTAIAPGSPSRSSPTVSSPRSPRGSRLVASPSVPATGPSMPAYVETSPPVAPLQVIPVPSGPFMAGQADLAAPSISALANLTPLSGSDVLTPLSILAPLNPSVSSPGRSVGLATVNSRPQSPVRAPQLSVSSDLKPLMSTIVPLVSSPSRVAPLAPLTALAPLAPVVSPSAGMSDEDRLRQMFTNPVDPRPDFKNPDFGNLNRAWLARNPATIELMSRMSDASMERLAESMRQSPSRVGQTSVSSDLKPLMGSIVPLVSSPSRVAPLTALAPVTSPSRMAPVTSPSRMAPVTALAPLAAVTSPSRVGQNSVSSDLKPFINDANMTTMALAPLSNQSVASSLAPLPTASLTPLTSVSTALSPVTANWTGVPELSYSYLSSLLNGIQTKHGFADAMARLTIPDSDFRYGAKGYVNAGDIGSAVALIFNNIIDSATIDAGSRAMITPWDIASAVSEFPALRDLVGLSDKSTPQAPLIPFSIYQRKAAGGFEMLNNGQPYQFPESYARGFIYGYLFSQEDFAKNSSEMFPMVVRMDNLIAVDRNDPRFFDQWSAIENIFQSRVKLSTPPTLLFTVPDRVFAAKLNRQRIAFTDPMFVHGVGGAGGYIGYDKPVYINHAFQFGDQDGLPPNLRYAVIRKADGTVDSVRADLIINLDVNGNLKAQ